MPQQTKGPRLYSHPQSGIWIIRDTGRVYFSTGTRDRGEADQILADYIKDKYGRVIGANSPDQITCGQVLEIYGEEHAPTVADPARIGYALKALLPFWGNITVSDTLGNTCRRYCKDRGVSNGTLRRELGTLRAALEYCRVGGYLTTAPAIWLPEKPSARERWLSRDEAAKLLWSAYRSKRGKHLARFILVALYTGSRKQSVLSLRYTPHVNGGHVDTTSGRLYRRGEGQRQTKKRQTPAALPRGLVAHLTRWEREGGRYVVEWKGERAGSIRKAWKSATRDAGLDDITPHTLRHTCATWLMIKGVPIWDAAGYLGMSTETLERTYGHHHADFMGAAREAMERK